MPPARPFDSRARDRRWLALAVLCTATVAINLDLTVMNIAIPAIAEGLDATGSELLWVVAAYGLAFACVVLAAGALADRFGHRRVFLIGVAWFGVSSTLAAAASSPAVLAAARFSTGIGAALVYPTTLAIIGDMFDAGSERRRAISFWVGIGSVGLILGPVFGGDLVDRFGWSAAFLVNPPLCLAMLALGPLLIPGDRHGKNVPVDLVGVVASAAGLAALLYGVIEGPERGWQSPLVIGPAVAGTVILAAFVVWESRFPSPMIDLGLFRSREFSAGSVALALPYLALPAWAIFLSQYLQFVRGASALNAGLVIAPAAVGQLGGALLAPRLIPRIGANAVAVLGTGLMALAAAAFCFEDLVSTMAHVSLNRFVDGVGTGLLIVPATDAIMRGIPALKEGIGIAVSTATRSAAAILGVGLIGGAFAVGYRWQMGRPEFVPESARQKAGESIGSSIDVASSLPPAVANRLLDDADAAFLFSFRVATVVTVTSIAIAGGIAWRYLPGREPAGGREVDMLGDPS